MYFLVFMDIEVECTKLIQFLHFRAVASVSKIDKYPKVESSRRKTTWIFGRIHASRRCLIL